MELFVGNLSSQTTRERLRELYQEYGTVSAVRLIVDKFSGLSRGFAFVDMPDDDQAAAAIAATHGLELDGSRLKVAAAQTSARHRAHHRVPKGG